jgi:hypothetical protein
VAFLMVDPTLSSPKTPGNFRIALEHEATAMSKSVKLELERYVVMDIIHLSFKFFHPIRLRGAMVARQIPVLPGAS